MGSTRGRAAVEQRTDNATAAIRAAHRDLLADVELLRATADLVGSESVDHLCGLLDEHIDFLICRLIPFARAEATLLYPVVEQALGTPEATRVMSRDLFAIGAMAEELAYLHQRIRRHGLAPDDAIAVRRVLYALHAVVRLHCDKEEDLYLPAVDRWLTSERGAALAGAVLDAAGRRR